MKTTTNLDDSLDNVVESWWRYGDCVETPSWWR